MGCGAGGMPGAQRVPSCPLDSDWPPWQALPTQGSTPPGVSFPTPGGSQPWGGVSGPKHLGAMRFQPQSLGSRLRSQGLRGWLHRTFGQKGSIWEAGCPRPPQGGNPMPHASGLGPLMGQSWSASLLGSLLPQASPWRARRGTCSFSLDDAPLVQQEGLVRRPHAPGSRLVTAMIWRDRH